MLEKLIKRFVYGSLKVSNVISLVKWDTMKLPSKVGGLDFRDMERHSKAFTDEEQPMPLLVATMLSPQGLWDLEKLSDMVPERIVHRIVTSHLLSITLGRDILSRRWSKCRSFSTKTTYLALSPESSHVLEGS
ncbi:hypothetical protein V6N12_065479 [Hibiscus sabdariffa]|uniref:Uncharacterized protein n=1 Tax=Hibiscus sabdariffa TaxID=183260 RepID=A0ABR2G8U6_9ROSI